MRNRRIRRDENHSLRARRALVGRLDVGGRFCAWRGSRVLIRAQDTVTYDISSDQAIRVIQVAGTFRFAADRNTRLDVGLIRIEPGEDASEDGFDCDAHARPVDSTRPGSALLVGTSERPIESGVVAKIRLVAFDGMNRETCPAIVCCGGRMEFHGSPISRTWVKIGQAIRKGDRKAQLAEPVAGWKIGDRVIITATERDGRKQGTLRSDSDDRRGFTEERIITAIDSLSLTLDRPLDHAHDLRGHYWRGGR